jgi:hypothetical protein
MLNVIIYLSFVLFIAYILFKQYVVCRFVNIFQKKLTHH